MNFLFLETVGYESALRLSGHHYARLLARRGHRVVSISTPVTPFHRLARANRAAIALRFEHHRRGWFEAPGGVLHYVPGGLIPIRKGPLLGSDLALRLAARAWIGDVLGRLREIDFKPDVISLQNLMLHPLVGQFSGAVLHYRMVDLIEGFADMPGSMIRLERRCIDEADIVSITSEQFAFKLAGGNEHKLILANNGVDLEHFREARPGPREYEGITRPIAVYVGALRAWFDWDLLAAVARACPEVQFVVISPDAPRADLSALDNFTHIPGVPYERIPAYYQHAAVGFIPFIRSPLVRGVNPIKLFECLAAGTPAVAVDWEELRAMDAPIGLAQGPDDFARLIGGAAAGDHPNDPAKRRDYAQFLSRFGWDANLDVLLERIQRIRAGRGCANNAAGPGS